MISEWLTRQFGGDPIKRPKPEAIGLDTPVNGQQAEAVNMEIRIQEHLTNKLNAGAVRDPFGPGHFTH